MAVDMSQERIVNEAARGFLGHVVPSVKCYPYRGREQFLLDFEAEQQQYLADEYTSEWFLLTGVDNTTLTGEFLEPADEKTPWTSWTSYDAELELLLVRMAASEPHEVASQTSSQILLEALEPLGLNRSLKNIGGTMHRVSMGGKKADAAFRPTRLPRGRSRDWPSVVLEVAFSETQSKLLSDIRYWVQASEGDVKNVLTMQIDRQRPKITIEKWGRNGESARHRCEQSVTISKRRNNNIVIANAPLMIKFEALFLRVASIPRERDIELDAEKLQYLAEVIWDSQGF